MGGVRLSQLRYITVLFNLPACPELYNFPLQVTYASVFVSRYEEIDPSPRRLRVHPLHNKEFSNMIEYSNYTVMFNWSHVELWEIFSFCFFSFFFFFCSSFLFNLSSWEVCWVMRCFLKLKTFFSLAIVWFTTCNIYIYIYHTRVSWSST